ncbi:hypothetical protein A2U01_0006024, partial [Trifolium medium]|nr:hypothetical protein [Trifolium medium]
TKEHISLPDPEAILKQGRKARRLALRKQQENSSPVVAETPNAQMAEQTMGSYYRRTDGEQFDGRINSDPWDHLSQFAETCEIQKVPEGVTEDQKKLRLFAYSLAGPAKDWLRCLPHGTIATWRDLEDKFKLLMRKCPNHSISAMEQMQIFVACMRMHHRLILDASAGGSIKNKTEATTR